MSPWEEIFDKAATEGTSLRLVYCDKGAKADLEKKTAARLEGRPKIPVGTFSVKMVAGDVNACEPVVAARPDQKQDIQWLVDASIRLDGVEMPGVSNVWLSASQTKGLAGVKTHQPMVQDMGGKYFLFFLFSSRYIQYCTILLRVIRTISEFSSPPQRAANGADDAQRRRRLLADQEGAPRQESGPECELDDRGGVQPATGEQNGGEAGCLGRSNCRAGHISRRVQSAGRHRLQQHGRQRKELRDALPARYMTCHDDENTIIFDFTIQVTTPNLVKLPKRFEI